MYSAIYEYLKKLKSSSTSADESNGRHILPPLIVDLCSSIESPTILDVGAGYGKDLLAVNKLSQAAQQLLLKVSLQQLNFYVRLVLT
jgi:hypothetical protein